MEDRLDSIFALQKGLENMMNLNRYPSDIEGRIAALCTAIIHEAVELQRTTNWKWWKKPTKFNEEEAKEELIDIWHFVVQASLELKLTPDAILDEYKRKNEINRDRQRNEYSSLIDCTKFVISSKFVTPILLIILTLLRNCWTSFDETLRTGTGLDELIILPVLSIPFLYKANSEYPGL